MKSCCCETLGSDHFLTTEGNFIFITHPPVNSRGQYSLPPPLWGKDRCAKALCSIVMYWHIHTKHRGIFLDQLQEGSKYFTPPCEGSEFVCPPSDQPPPMLLTNDHSLTYLYRGYCVFYRGVVGEI